MVEVTVPESICDFKGFHIGLEYINVDNKAGFGYLNVYGFQGERNDEHG